MVIGDRRKFVSALIVPTFESVEAYAEEKGIEYESREALVQQPGIVALFQGEVDSAMEDFAQYEKVKKFALLPREWTIAENELTPTLKVKRRIVEEKYGRSLRSFTRKSRNRTRDCRVSRPGGVLAMAPL